MHCSFRLFYPSAKIVHVYFCTICFCYLSPLPSTFLCIWLTWSVNCRNTTHMYWFFKAWHKSCFKCGDCSKRLDSVNCCEGPDKDIYCKGAFQALKYSNQLQISTAINYQWKNKYLFISVCAFYKKHIVLRICFITHIYKAKSIPNFIKKNKQILFQYYSTICV